LQRPTWPSRDGENSFSIVTRKENDLLCRGLDSQNKRLNRLEDAVGHLNAKTEQILDALGSYLREHGRSTSICKQVCDASEARGGDGDCDLLSCADDGGRDEESKVRDADHGSRRRASPVASPALTNTCMNVPPVEVDECHQSLRSMSTSTIRQSRSHAPTFSRYIPELHSAGKRQDLRIHILTALVAQMMQGKDFKCRGRTSTSSSFRF
jgi:hypothetical protein